ncbi:ATP-binding protein [Candidatus Micrarchaeota archaeon]|nr:ATP-binding protein [Candidatus Micrarchaeota archaeon]
MFGNILNFTNESDSGGVDVGERIGELSFLKKTYVAEYYPKLRVRPIPAWRWKGVGGRFSIDFNSEANCHVNISGMSGFGKSTLCKRLIAGIREKLKLPVSIFDVHSEYAEFTSRLGGKVHSPKESSINMWELDGASPAERISENVTMLKRILKLGDIQAYSLLSCAEKAYERKGITQAEQGSWRNETPTMQDVYDCIDESMKGRGRQGYSGLSKRLYPLMRGDVFSAKTTLPFSTILDGLNDFSIAELGSSEAQALFIETFLRKLYTYMLSQKLTDRMRLFAVIDEAHRVCISSPEELSLPGRLVSEGRKYGLGIITSNQMVKSLDRAIVANSAVTFAFYQREPEECDYMTDLISGGVDYERRKEVGRALRNLKQFECIVLTSNDAEPVVVKVAPESAELEL